MVEALVVERLQCYAGSRPASQESVVQWCWTTEAREICQLRLHIF